jgi:hypothetical protein
LDSISYFKLIMLMVRGGGERVSGVGEGRGKRAWGEGEVGEVRRDWKDAEGRSYA